MVFNLRCRSEYHFRRIKNFSNYCNANANIYGVHNLLADLRWGPASDRELARLLCLQEKPVIIWIVSEVHSMWFFCQGVLQPNVRHLKASDQPAAFPFEHFYDASKQFGLKDQMQCMNPNQVGKNDLVMVECNVTCWKVDADGKSSYTDHNWVKWRMGLELLSIAFLFEGQEDEDPRESTESSDAPIPEKWATGGKMLDL
ncbi:hypothetical protein BKA93DRAFT_750999 [Sparassis latifolia]